MYRQRSAEERSQKDSLTREEKLTKVETAALQVCLEGVGTQELLQVLSLS